MNDLISCGKPRLYYARERQAARLHARHAGDTAGWDLPGWRITGDWHIMTVDTNDDRSSGLDGGVAVDCLGAWLGGSLEREIYLAQYGEILFEHYIQNGVYDTEGNENRLTFYVDGAKALEIEGPSPWTRCRPIGLTPGVHTIRFEYTVNGNSNLKKGVIDNIVVWQGAETDCLISKAVPPKPVRSIGKNRVLRGFTRHQEMTAADTEIVFTALFDASGFLNFIRKCDGEFYYTDEFGICYKGIFPEVIEPKHIAVNSVYSVDLVMIAGQKTGVGFCAGGGLLCMT